MDPLTSQQLDTRKTNAVQKQIIFRVTMPDFKLVPVADPVMVRCKFLGCDAMVHNRIGEYCVFASSYNLICGQRRRS